MKHLSQLTVLVLGLGDSGLAMARWCARHGAHVRVWDSRENPPQSAELLKHVPAAERLSGALDVGALAGVRLVLKSPGLAPADARIHPLLERARDTGVLVQGELDLFAHALADLKAERGYAPKVLAITGTNGKTTTTSMTAMLVARTGRRTVMAGNIGPTLLQTLSDALDLEPAPESLAETDATTDAAEPTADAMAAAPVPADDVDEASVDADALGAVDLGDEEPAALDDAERDLSALAALDGVTLADVALAGEADELAVADNNASADTEAAPASAAEAAAALVAANAARLDAQITGGGPPPHLIPPPPPGPVFEHLPEVWVLELSSFQLDEVKGFEPDAATVLNITQDHLDWHGSMAAYAGAKARIFGPASGSRTVMVINRDDPATEQMVPAPIPVKGRGAKPIVRRVVRFGLDAPQHPGDFGLVTENGMAWLVRAMEADETVLKRPRRGAAVEAEDLVIQRLMPADALRVRGRHNASNALAALALATSVGCPLAPMLHGLREYGGERHRGRLAGPGRRPRAGPLGGDFGWRGQGPRLCAAAGAGAPPCARGGHAGPRCRGDRSRAGRRRRADATPRHARGRHALGVCPSAVWRLGVAQPGLRQPRHVPQLRTPRRGVCERSEHPAG
jgi:UDP-N-acetylmuramoylalanine--D-glutamate ligase